ncbi:disks large-associated protein 5 isoform X2 [Pygocentrus nattereri]|uniref:disks large-associated protein 5 isoform X2 n=1 Tax=Pygocentrus nattereri TaxID=42514 RepID=UPI0008144EBA|nr:disks large-associated protein 5 isoform X2 [Pygocentrus nattereri]
MDSRFAHLYKRDSSVSMIRVKMSRRRSQTQKENRERMQNQRRHLDQLPELELSMDVSTLEKSIVHAQRSECKKKADKSNSAVEERKKMLERFKENKTLQKEKEKREKEKKGVFKVGLYRPQPLGYLPLNPVVPSTVKSTESMQFTRVTRSMKQQQLKLPTEKQTAPKKVEHAPSARVNKPAAKPSGRGRTDAAEPAVRAPTTRSAAKASAAAVPAKAVIKPASDLRALKTRPANRQPTALSAGRGKPMQEDTASVPAVEHTEATVNPSSVKEKTVEEAKVTPTSFAPQGFVFQPPSGLRTFQPTPLSPHSADAFLSPSFCFESKTESTILALPSSESFAATAASPLSSLPSCSSNPAPAPVAPSSPPPFVSSSLLPASPSLVSAPVEPQHDVSYFRAVMADETKRLTGLSEMWELRFDDASIPEEMRDRMRTAVGQARLLMKERFGQFSGLVDDCDLGRGEKITTCSDLQGFWDMVYFQVEDVNKKFNTLKEAEARGWQEETKPVTKLKKVVRKPPVAGGKTGAGSGASTAAKSRLAAVKAAMKAKAAAEKAAVASDDTPSASDAPANPLATQTVIFHGGFFQVESPVKVVDSPRVRLSAAPLPQSSPFVSKFNTPCRQKRSAVSHSSPNPHITLTSTEVASPTANPVEVPHPAAYHTCTPQRPAEPLPCSSQPLQFSPEHHRPSLQASPTGVSHTESTQPDRDTSDDISPIQSDLANAPVDSPMQESTEIKPQISPCQSEAELPLFLPESTDISPEPEGCIQESNAITALSQEQAEAPMLTELNGSPLVCTTAGASPVKAHTQSFTLSPPPSKTASPQAQMAERLLSSPSGPLMMSISPPRVCVLSPAPSDSAIIPVSERSPICSKIEMTENPGPKNIAELDFERYLQPTARCSLSPVQSMAAERFSLGTADAEMESPQSQAEDSVQDVIMTPRALHRIAPLVFTPWTEQLTDNPLPFTPEQRDRVRQSVCDRDLMMFTPPSSK